ncbi:MAG TPA: deaminase [Gammaproteobacteria bacterium]|nr:deaminase [Gammaproteobacteria bacterium]
MLRAAAQKTANYCLINTILYVTLEPCMMCTGALKLGVLFEKSLWKVL